MPDPDKISGRILRHVRSKDYQPQRMRKLARSIGVEETEYAAFRAAVKALMKAGRVVRGSSNCVMLPEAAGVIVGTFRGNARGFGFVVPEPPTDHGDLFIPPDATLDAITGDTVAARITRRGKRGDSSLVEGKVVEILERGQSRFVGELVREGGRWMLRADGHSLHRPVLLGDVHSTRAHAGDQVVVELTEFPAGDRPPRGVIVEVLGRRGDSEIDTISTIRQYHLRDEFPEEVLVDARRAIRNYDTGLDQREDLRSEVVITIDPDDAKDYDDAISVRPLGRGRIELGVHIADVSAFVLPDSPLDDEARTRGNSVYFPRRVLPMLPEVLSNGLCSLQEDEPRLAKSVFIEYSGKGNRLSKRYANTVIQSHKRLTYDEATRILEGRTRGFKPEVVQLLDRMNKLARAVHKRRLAAGMIVLDLPGTELVLDDDDAVVDVVPEDTSFSHTIIEMFMIEANEAVAELFSQLNVPHLRRVHAEPPGDAQTKLAGFLRVLGRPLPRRLERSDLLRLLDNVRDTAESFAVNLAVLRSMARAEYSPKTIGHYALASGDYCHFTSPIRRYPDLVVHRLLQTYLTGQLGTRRQRASVPSAEALTEVGAHCSFTERHAEAAERELKLVKVLRFLDQRVGETAEGLVTGVTNVGVFVQLVRYRVEGLIRFADLPDDWWDVKPRAGCVVGQRSGVRIAIGDPVAVEIASVNLAARELDLVLAPEPPKSRGRKTGRSVSKAKEKTEPARSVSRKTKTNRPSTRASAARRRGRR